jgi:hypothetical protein
MAQSRGCTAIRILWGVAVDMLRLVSLAARSQAQLAVENLFLRKQLTFYVERQVKPRRSDDATRITLVALSSLIEWRRILTIVKPDTLIGWHRKGFRLFWRRKSTPRGRPRLPTDLRQLIRDGCEWVTHGRSHTSLDPAFRIRRRIGVKWDRTGIESPPVTK